MDITSTEQPQAAPSSATDESSRFARLYEDTYLKVVRFAFYRLGERSIAEDVAADAFALAWSRRHQADTFAVGWLFATAKNLIGHEYRRRKRVLRRQREMITATLAEPDTWAMHVRDLDLQRALSRLKPDDSLVLQLTYWDGLSAGEAAAFLDCSTSAVWTRLNRARAALRLQLESEGQEEVRNG